MNKHILPLPEQKEATRHGEITFPIQKYTTTLSSEAPIVAPHWHEEAEFTLITSGTAIYQLQLEKYEVQPGDLVFISPLLLHSIIKESEDLVSETFVFHLHFLGSGSSDVCSIRYLNPITQQKLVTPFFIRKSHPVYAEALQLFYKLNNEWEQQKPGYELLLKAHLLNIIALLLPYSTEAADVSPLQTEHTKKIKTALQYISIHLTEDISVADVAATCYFSEYYFMRFFKKNVGMSCMDYIKNLRLEKAVALFENGNTSILDVSLASGFHNLPYFYREFKKKYGMTPKQFLLHLQRQ